MFLTKPFITIEDARSEGKRIWRTNSFDIIEVEDEGCEYGLYEAIRYVPAPRTA